MVEQLGRSGLVSVEEDTAMQNHEAVETFYADYLDGRDSMVTVSYTHLDVYKRQALENGRYTFWRKNTFSQKRFC